LKLGLSMVLIFIGAKMLLTAVGVHIPIGLSLGVVGLVLGSSVAASLMWPRAAAEHPQVTHDPLDPTDDPPGSVVPPVVESPTRR
ncbi:MAG TPA: hypothetical protein VGV85_00180, partial [Longimicrobiaceae bacterium]|nr:hypothetical protein [Longimicrobiaceae bacterium]